MVMIILFTVTFELVVPSFIFIPWTSPIIIGSLLSVAGQSAVAGLGFVVLLPIINLIMAIIVYIPITLVYNKRYVAQEKIKIAAGTRLEGSLA